MVSTEGQSQKAMAANNNRIEQQCRAKRMRMTAQRRLVARVLAEAHDHPDVMELRHRISRRRDTHVSLATLYRTLKLLTEAGIIERHYFRDNRARYEGAPTTHHDHLIDLVSGRVMDFRSEEIERLIAETASHLGYELVAHRLELYAVPINVEIKGKNLLLRQQGGQKRLHEGPPRAISPMRRPITQNVPDRIS